MNKYQVFFININTNKIDDILVVAFSAIEAQKYFTDNYKGEVINIRKR
jgi:hypothetical protein